MENERGTHDSNFLLIQRNPQHVQGKKGLLRQKQECEESAPRTFPFPTALVVFCIVLSRKKTSFLRLLFFADFPSSTARERSAAPMSMIKVEDLTFSYPASHDRIFDSVSFQIDTNWKLGFVGRNGRGKTTFLQLLMGNYPYQGTIVSSVPFDYFPYPVADQTQWTQDVLQSVCPQAQSWELLRELSYLDVDPEVLFRPFATLSKGEQTKVLLAALFLKEGHFLLIDEPTNHLDTQARDLVSAYLRRKQGFILVSHDRHFLDGCVDHILSLNRANITVQNGTFSTWLENFNRQQAFEQAQKEGLQKDIARLRKAARQTSVWSDRIEEKKYGAGPVDRGYIGHKAQKMMKRAKAIEARQQQAIQAKSGLLQNWEPLESLKLSPLPCRGDRPLAVFSQVKVQYCGRDVCGPVSFALHPGERVVLDGKNGSGKSSLLKVLLGESIPHSGTITTSAGLVVSYVPQDTAHLNGLLSHFAEKHHLDESLFKGILRKMGFERVQFEKKMEDFSAGQKKKVLLAASLCQPAHLYVWDEPPNFVDLHTRLQITSLLRQAQPTMLFVEHDRAFQEEIATQKISL